MHVYIYSADLWCKKCGNGIREWLTRRGLAVAKPNDEYSYDSDDFPKGPYPDGGGLADYPRHCAAGRDCIDAITLPNGEKIGVWLENDLTADGVKHVRESAGHAPDNEMYRLWAEEYGLELSY